MKKFVKKRESRKEVITHPRHPEQRLVTRRDFLSSGLLSFAGTAMIPSLLTSILFEQQARAGVAPPCPFILFDGQGGFNMPGNFMALDPTGALLGSYSTVGLGGGGFMPDYSFGHPMAAPYLDIIAPPFGSPPGTPNTITVSGTSTAYSQIYGAMTGFSTVKGFTTSSLNPNILGPMAPAPNVGGPSGLRYPNAKIKFGGIPLNCQSDSQTNVTSPLGFIAAAGLQGSMIQTGMGMTAALSGGNSAMGEALTTFKALEIQSSQALPAALSYGSTLSSLGQGPLNAIINALNSLTSTQVANLNSMTNGQQLGALISSGLTTNSACTNTSSCTQPPVGIDPFLDSDASSIYGLSNESKNSGSFNAIAATLVLNAVMGNSGPVVIRIGGCDYHDQTQTTGDGIDATIGNQFAMAMNLAYAKLTEPGAKFTKVAFGFLTDGGIYTGDNNRIYMGDDNQHSHCIFGVMDVTGQTTMSNLLSIGGYVNNLNPNSGLATQTADPNNPISNDPLKACHVMAMNYMAVNNLFNSGSIAGGYMSLVTSQFPRDESLMPNLFSGNLQTMANACLLFPPSTTG